MRIRIIKNGLMYGPMIGVNLPIEVSVHESYSHGCSVLAKDLNDKGCSFDDDDFDYFFPVDCYEVINNG